MLGLGVTNKLILGVSANIVLMFGGKLMLGLWLGTRGINLRGAS